jgi:hypothetical protein
MKENTIQFVIHIFVVSIPCPTDVIQAGLFDGVNPMAECVEGM